MNIEFLLSFKDYDELLNLDDEFIKSLPDNFLKTYSKKVKKKLLNQFLKIIYLKIQNYKQLKIKMKIKLI